MPVIDPVTGAHARAALQEAIADVAGCGLLLFDVDHFKTINDAFGHQRGDTLLRQLADRVRELIREDDVLFRYGGDEFVLLLPDTGPQEALRLAIRLTDEVRGRPFAGTPPLHLSISVGVASSPADGTDGDALIAAADRRNYLAKRRGRGQAAADDADQVPPDESSRLWERDAALTATHEFLTRLGAGDRGALRVTGPPGAGHTRFLREVAAIARLRGVSLVLADVGEPVPFDAAADGLVYATTDPDDGRETLVSVELTPWSPATLRIWLRTSIPGEPTDALVGWLAARTGGLPARAVTELARLRERDGLVSTGDGRWTVRPDPAAVNRRARRLPVPMTKLVGRDREAARICGLVRDGRLVTLVGPGGIGKTRLSLAVAGTLAGEFRDGAVFVPLADATGAELVVAALARALGVTEAPGQSLLDLVHEELAEAHLLLVLDNFEQVVDDAAVLVSELLAAASEVSALVTSRERLSLYGEQVYRVPALADSPALTLFEQRARAVDADFEVTVDTALTVATLCRRLDGLPLAIELAAARIDRWSPDELLDRLTNHLDELGDDAAGPRDLPARQQTLRGAIDWSFVLLDAEEQRLFTALAVFVGGWTLDAAVAVTGCGDPDLLRKRLTALVDKSLVVQEGDERFRLLATIRAYATQRLGDERGPRDRHAVHYAAFAEASAAGLSGPEQVAWAGRVEADFLNVRAAFDHAGIDTKARICLGLWRYWRNGAHLGEGREWLDRVLGAPVELDDATRAKLLYGAAILAATQDEHERAYALGAECLARAEAAGDRATMGHGHNAMGIASIGAGDHDAATAHFAQCLTTWRELSVPQGIAAALGNLSKVALGRGEFGAARRYAEECLALERSGSNTRGIQLALECLGQALLGQGDVAAARAALSESLALSRQIGDAFGAAMAQHQLGLAARREGRPDEAFHLLTAALVTRHQVGDRLDLAISLDVVAALLVDDHPALAARLVGAADGLRARHRLPLPPDSETLRSSTLPKLTGHRLPTAEPLDDVVALLERG